MRGMDSSYLPLRTEIITDRVNRVFSEERPQLHKIPPSIPSPSPLLPFPLFYFPFLPFTPRRFPFLPFPPPLPFQLSFLSPKSSRNGAG